MLEVGLATRSKVAEELEHNISTWPYARLPLQRFDEGGLCSHPVRRQPSISIISR